MEYTKDYLTTLYAIGMGYATEGGKAPYKISVTRQGNVIIGKSGYSAGVIQFDFGAQGTNAYAEATAFVKMVSKWAEDNKFEGFKSESDTIVRLIQRGNKVNDMPLSAADTKLMNDFLEVPENQAKFFMRFEKPIMDEKLFGKTNSKGIYTTEGVECLITIPSLKEKFERMTVSDQIRTLTMVSKIGNQTNPDNYRKAFDIIGDIPKENFNANHIKKELLTAFNKNRALCHGIEAGDGAGKVFARINSSPALSEMHKSGKADQAFDTSTVEAKPELLFLSVISRNAVGKGGIPNSRIMKFIDNIDAGKSAFFVEEDKKYKNGAIKEIKGYAIGVNKDGTIYAVNKKTGLGHKKTANGWETTKASEFIEQFTNKKGKIAWRPVDPQNVKKEIIRDHEKAANVAPEITKAPAERQKEPSRNWMDPFLDWTGEKFQGLHESWNKISRTKAGDSEAYHQNKAAVNASEQGNVKQAGAAMDSAVNRRKEIESGLDQFGKLAPDAPVAQQKQAAINASVAKMLLAGSNKSPEEQAKIMEIANRITADHIQAGNEIEKPKLYDPQAEPNRVVRAFTLEELQKSQNQEKGIERQKEIQFGA